jgi:uncharacterized protein (DUF2249 family)
MLDPDSEPVRPAWDKAGVHGIARPRAWDTVVTSDAEGLHGNSVTFVALPDGALVVESADGEGDPTPLAAAVEAEISRPYRAEAVRRGESLWAIAARRIELAQFVADGDELELTAHDGERTLAVDGQRVFGSVAALEPLGDRHRGSFAVRARRVEGDWWEVQSDPL